jgi:type I restriction enzyme S subunit
VSFPSYPEYKDSGAQWLGQVPSAWASMPFGALFRRTKRIGFADEELLSVYRDYGVIRKSDRDDNFNNASDDLSTYQLVEPGDLAMNKMKAWQGSLGISSHRGIVSPAYFVFSPRREFHPPFLHYLLRSPPYAAGYMTISKGIRINQWDVDPDHLSSLPVLFPSLDEQAAIAAFLDRETAKIDALVVEQERLIALLKEKRQAVISHAVTKGLNPHAPMKDSGIEWLGEIPAHWEVMKFVRAVSIAEGQVDPKEHPYSEMVLIAPNHIQSGTGRLLALETASEQNAESGKYQAQAGDVIYSKIRPSLAKSAVAPLDCLCSADMYPLKPRSRLRAEFLNYFILSPAFTAWATLESERVAMPKINREKLNEVMLAIPPLIEQDAIVGLISEATGRFDDLEAEAQAAITLLQERRAALISAAVTGKIDVRGLVDQHEMEAA